MMLMFINLAMKSLFSILMLRGLLELSRSSGIIPVVVWKFAWPVFCFVNADVENVVPSADLSVNTLLEVVRVAFFFEDVEDFLLVTPKLLPETCLFEPMALPEGCK